MTNVKDDQFDDAMGNLLDAVYDLGIKLSDKPHDELSEEENSFLEALDVFTFELENLE
ncbi:hypothetical protein [Bacillus infantis]|uniref:hypothetical protein n=1 Tax=Bacillus infantis TaxID=324767 RepID=UPI00209D15F5|nr:hypothetical protein [Bacillus infantis]MCP1159278.1 hypothetical protein [Bacillus infantis]